MKEECNECGKEFEEGDRFILQENHTATIKEGWLHTSANSLIDDIRYCTKCWKEEGEA